MKEILIQKIKSPVLWTSFAALVAFVCKEWFGYEIPGFDDFVKLFLAFLIAFGVVNNPNDRKNI